MKTSALNQLLTPNVSSKTWAKLRSLTPTLSQWERGPTYADRCPSQWSVALHRRVWSPRCESPAQWSQYRER